MVYCFGIRSYARLMYSSSDSSLIRESSSKIYIFPDSDQSEGVETNLRKDVKGLRESLSIPCRSKWDSNFFFEEKSELKVI